VNDGDRRHVEAIESVDHVVGMLEPCLDVIGAALPRNSPTSAPAMKPPRLAERITSALGGSFSITLSTSPSSRTTSSDKVLALEPCLSINSQAMPSSSRASRQFFHGPGGTESASTLRRS
jgi:hypothetical protein